MPSPIDRLSPVVKVITLLVYAAMLARGGWPDMLLGLLLIVAGFVLATPGILPGVLVMIRQVRWLLVFLFLVYGWLTPGVLIWPTGGSYSPTVEGLQAGLNRASALLLMVAGTHLLLATTERGGLVSALTTLSQVARPLGLDPERFAIRVVLTLEAVAGARGHVADALVHARNSGGRIADTAANLYRSVVDDAHVADEMRTITIPSQQNPPPSQWLVPVAVFILFAITAYGVVR